MSLLSVITDAVSTAFDILGDLSQKGELITQEQYKLDPVKDLSEYIEKKYSFQAFELGTKESEQLNQQIEGVDFYLLAKFDDSAAVPKVLNQVELGGIVYEIKYIDKVKPGSSVILWTIGVAQ